MSPTAPRSRTVDKTIIAIAVFLLAQTVLTRYARYVSFAFGEKVLAELREDFVEQSLALPIGTVERAGTGDLLTRTSRDVEALGWSVRFAVPETIIAIVTTIFTVVACMLVGAWVLVPLVLGVPVLFVATRWYLRRAKPGYLRESASYAAINASVAETAEGARTVEALGLEQRPAATGSTPTSRSRTPPSATRCSCARCGSRRPRSATSCRPW